MTCTGHFRVICSCGVVIRQCRCFSPSKAQEVVAHGCDRCKRLTAAERGDEPPRAA